MKGVEMNGQEEEWTEMKTDYDRLSEGSRGWGSHRRNRGRSHIIEHVKEQMLTPWPHPSLLPSPGQSFFHGQ